MYKPMAILFSFFCIFFFGNCFAMHGVKVAPARVVQDANGLPLVSVYAKSVSVLRSASPSIQPDHYCNLLAQAVFAGTEHTPNNHSYSERPASPLLGRCLSPASFLSEVNIPERTQTPWDLNFGPSLLPALKKVEEGNAELGEKFKLALEQFATQLMKRRNIRCVRAQSTMNGVSVLDPFLDKLEKGRIHYEIECSLKEQTSQKPS